jgi:hypothetical protein
MSDISTAKHITAAALRGRQPREGDRLRALPLP